MMRFLEAPYPFGIGRRTWPLFALGALAVLLIAFPFDHRLSVWGTGLPDGVRSFFFAVTDIGLSDWILIPAVVLFVISALLAVALRGKPKPYRALVQMSYLYAFIFLGVGLPGLIANIVKRIVGRGRPEVYDVTGSFSFEYFINDWAYQSFVSGHTATIFAVAFVIGFLSHRWFWPALAVAVLVGVSRVVVGAHYPTDVLGGVIVGTIGAYAVRNLFASRRVLFEYRSDGTVRLRSFAAVSRLVRRRDRTRS
jgi:undecaprenyl-diphosphatase